MESLHTPHAPFHLDPARLRRYRLQKRWRQRDLAQAAGFSEDYISQLERAPTTRNKGTRAETLVKLAQPLGVLPVDLLFEDIVRQSPTDDLLHPVLFLVDTIRSSDPPGEPGTVQNERFAFRIDPGKLRAARLKKQWKQRDLARAAGFSEDYISQLERAATTRNKGTRLDTLLRLAHALEIAPVDLLPEKLAESLQADITRRELLGNAASFGIAGLLFSKTTPSARYTTTLTQRLHVESLGVPSETVVELRHRARLLASQGLWLQAEDVGLIARSMSKPGSEEWVDITISHCAQMRQQAGDVLQVEAYIKHALQQHAAMVDLPDSRVLALIDAQRGWLACEQFGNYQQGYQYFTGALHKALQVGDSDIESTARHFRFRILSELAMHEGGAWLEARPVRRIHEKLVRLLHQSLEADWPRSCHGNPENLHALNRRWMAYALIQPDQAIREIPKLISISRSIGAEHVIDLTLARWHISNGEWETASALADQGFQGYCRVAFPQGIALAAAMRADALFRSGLRAKPDCCLCLNLWLLTLLLHPYESHPLWSKAYNNLRKTVQCIQAQNPTWLHSYYHEINARVEQRDGVFQALQYIYININRITPTHYLNAL